MNGCCGDPMPFTGKSARYRRVLLLVIAINVIMFLVEMTAGLMGQSQALKADSLDFLGDSLTYALSLAVLGMSDTVRARAAIVKGGSLAVLAAFVLGLTIYRTIVANDPEPMVMSGVGLMALLANLGAAVLLLRYREGDANVRSVWLCSRNDAIGNAGVVAGGGLVAWTGSHWPDLIVAGVLAVLFTASATAIIRQARAELSRIPSSRNGVVSAS